MRVLPFEPFPSRESVCSLVFEPAPPSSQQLLPRFQPPWPLLGEVVAMHRVGWMPCLFCAWAHGGSQDAATCSKPHPDACHVPAGGSPAAWP